VTGWFSGERERRKTKPLVDFIHLHARLDSSRQTDA